MAAPGSGTLLRRCLRTIMGAHNINTSHGVCLLPSVTAVSLCPLPPVPSSTLWDSTLQLSFKRATAIRACELAAHAGERNGVLDVPDKARRCAGASCAGTRDARGTGVGTSCTRCAVLGRGGGGALLSSATVLCGSEAAASNTRPALSAATAAVAFPACWSPAVASADAGLALAPSATASLGQLHVVMQCQGR